MNAPVFQPGDQITPAEDGWWAKNMPCVPKLHAGRVYLVEAATQRQGRLFVKLAGHHHDKRSKDVDDFWPAGAFVLVDRSVASPRRQQAMQRVPGRLLIELDDLASAMLRRVCQDGAEHFDPGHDPRDLVSAAVTYYLCGENDADGLFSLNDSTEALTRATTARTALERGEAA